MPNPVVSFEIKSTDIEATAAFFGEVFGWEASVAPEYGGFLDTRSEDGIMGGVAPALDGRSAVTFYIGVDDVQAYLDKAVAAGGQVVMPPVEITEGVSLALFSDPAGAVVGLMLNG